MKYSEIVLMSGFDDSSDIILVKVLTFSRSMALWLTHI